MVLIGIFTSIFSSQRLAKFAISLKVVKKRITSAIASKLHTTGRLRVWQSRVVGFDLSLVKAGLENEERGPNCCERTCERMPDG